MDENISAPPSIKLNINEESNIDYYPSPDEIENKAKDEQYTISNNNIDYNDKENNNYDNNVEYEEKGIEEEQEQIQRPLNGNNIIVIGTIRLVFQSIAVALVYGIAIWAIILEIIHGFTYGIVDIAILIAFATFMLIWTIKKRSISGVGCGVLTVVVAFFSCGIFMYSYTGSNNSIHFDFVIFLIVRTIIFIGLIIPLNCNK